MLLVGMLQYRMFGIQTCYFLHQHKLDRNELKRFLHLMLYVYAPPFYRILGQL